MTFKARTQLIVAANALIIVAIAHAFADSDSAQEHHSSTTVNVIDATSTTTLDADETTHLVFMREEEKLARNVYITLGMIHPEYAVFGNIDDSEQRHTYAVCDMLKKYEVDDPSTNDNVGVFTGEDYDRYFTGKYKELVEKGSISALDTLQVGALIEELDMDDILYCPKEILEQDNDINNREDCGKIYTDNPGIQHLYTSLLEGSENHLRAFIKNIESIQGEGSYKAQYLTQKDVDNILQR